jgi:hypothetical protein
MYEDDDTSDRSARHAADPPDDADPHIIAIQVSGVDPSRI